jgi:hypothetical protein
MCYFGKKKLQAFQKKDQGHFPLAASEIVGHGNQPFDMGLMDTQWTRYESLKTVLVSIGPNLVHSKQGIVQEDILLNFKNPYINCSSMHMIMQNNINTYFTYFITFQNHFLFVSNQRIFSQ